MFLPWISMWLVLSKQTTSYTLIQKDGRLLYVNFSWFSFYFYFMNTGLNSTLNWGLNMLTLVNGKWSFFNFQVITRISTRTKLLPIEDEIIFFTHECSNIIKKGLFFWFKYLVQSIHSSFTSSPCPCSCTLMKCIWVFFFSLLW